jgi:NAD(P)-dependent dehydrogenase (short-subunit alcohol dehydrogenase family)
MTRVVLVTGSTDGIGRQTARQLAAGGMKVIVHGRSKAKVDATLDALRGELPGGELDGVAFDLGRLGEVRRGAELILKQAPELHVVVHNAGLFANERVVTADGLELTFAVDYLAPFLLTELLAPRLEASAQSAGVPSRVLQVASIAHVRGKIQLDDLQLERGFTGYGAYAQAKLAQVMHAITLAEKRDAGKLVAYSLHPGVVGTKLLREGFGAVQGSSVEHGARTSVRLAGGEQVDEPSGSYFSDGVAAQPAPAARDAKVRAALWDASLKLAKL